MEISTEKKSGNVKFSNLAHLWLHTWLHPWMVKNLYHNWESHKKQTPTNIMPFYTYFVMNKNSIFKVSKYHSCN